MRVECLDVSEFMANLETVPVDGLFNGTIYFRKTENNSQGGLKSEVIIQATAVIRQEDGSEYLLVLGQSCGLDFKDQGGSFEGTKKADRIKKQLEQLCATRSGWRLLPGLVSE